MQLSHHTTEFIPTHLCKALRPFPKKLRGHGSHGISRAFAFPQNRRGVDAIPPKMCFGILWVLTVLTVLTCVPVLDRFCLLGFWSSDFLASQATNKPNPRRIALGPVAIPLAIGHPISSLLLFQQGSNPQQEIRLPHFTAQLDKKIRAGSPLIAMLKYRIPPSYVWPRIR